MDEWKRSGQIPAFGNWDMANDLPITQYFECARQAGLVRFSSSSGESGDRDLYTPDSKQHVSVPYRNNSNNTPSYSNHNHGHKQATRNRERRCHHGGGGGVVNKEKGSNNNNVNVVARKQGRVYDVVLEQPRKPIRVISKQLDQDDTVSRTPPRRAPKPVDEDLYKIPPELLHTTKRKRKKMLGFISKCLVPAACVS